MAHGTMSRVQFEAAMQAKPIPESPEESSAFEFHPNEAE